MQTGVEACDDGNEEDQDACRNTCELARCGDGVVQNGVEACDDGNDIETDGCRNTCVVAACGDGVVHAEVEACDDGNDSDADACLGDCTLNVCGDGILNVDAEACDDGNVITEECEYGVEACEVCTAECALAPGATHLCGDGVVDASEECDDGNRVTELCPYGELECTVCNETCVEEPGRANFCGDGLVSAADGEGCDEGNANGDQSCASDCQVPAACTVTGLRTFVPEPLQNLNVGVICNPDNALTFDGDNAGLARLGGDPWAAPAFGPDGLGLLFGQELADADPQPHGVLSACVGIELGQAVSLHSVDLAIAPAGSACGIRCAGEFCDSGQQYQIIGAAPDGDFFRIGAGDTFGRVRHPLNRPVVVNQLAVCRLGCGEARDHLEVDFLAAYGYH